ncbi:MAG: hypothetical protein O3B07_07300 [Verrucomicrobia bacterium]|nr:hypothetical protein [Verrucomicrobiota bacterium]
MSIRCKNLLALIVLSPFCFGGVASNPFLRPGSNRPPPQVSPPPPPPKPAPNPAIANEVEFRGYFLLKGVPHFCIFNKKANLGEWIKLTEKTYEEFEAQAFDLESETLTLAFNGQDFTLTLEQSKSMPQQTSPTPALPKVKLPPGVSTSSSGTPKVMPPKPRTQPKLPDWLADRLASRTGSSYSSQSPSVGSTGKSSSGLPLPPSRIAPFSSTSITGGTSSSTPFTGSPISSTTERTFQPDLSNPSSAAPTIQVPSNVDLPVTETNEQTGLEDLPPPPPPPNILPPSPPPDILPSLDE